MIDPTTNTSKGTLTDAKYEFDRPYRLAYDGTNLWVGNTNSNTVTEIAGADGAWVRTLKDPSYGFSVPAGIATDGLHVWVANDNVSTGNSVTEFSAATGALIQVIPDQARPGTAHTIWAPTDVTFDGWHIWVTNAYGNTVTEIDSATGNWIRTITADPLGSSAPQAAIFDGRSIWVLNSRGSVTRIRTN